MNHNSPSEKLPNIHLFGAGFVSASILPITYQFTGDFLLGTILSSIFGLLVVHACDSLDKALLSMFMKAKKNGDENR
jgi:hypothetical protein